MHYLLHADKLLYRIFPHTILVGRKTILKFRRKTRILRQLRRCGVIDLTTVKNAFFGAMGHFEQADSLHLRLKLFWEVWV